MLDAGDGELRRGGAVDGGADGQDCHSGDDGGDEDDGDGERDVTAASFWDGGGAGVLPDDAGVIRRRNAADVIAGNLNDVGCGVGCTRLRHGAVVAR